MLAMTGVMETRTVWAVSRGSYSDYGIVAIFETEAQANEWVHLGEFVEEFHFTPAGEKPIQRSVYNASWNSQRGDAGIHVYEAHEIGTEDAFFQPADIARWHSGYVVSARGTDRQRVVKSVADKLAEYKARSAGIADA